MKLRKTHAGASFAALALLPIFLSPLTPKHAFAASASNVAKGVAVASDQGRIPVGEEQNLTVFLKLHNREAFDKRVNDLYDPTSPSFHKWLSEEELQAYAPTAGELQTVKQELIKQGLSLVSSDPNHFSVRVRGTTASIETAFQTELHNFSLNGRIFQAHVRDAQLSGEAGGLVDSVVGLNRHKSRPLLTVAKDPLTGRPLFKEPLAGKDPGTVLRNEITNQALSTPELVTYPTPGAALPIGVFYGSVYNKNPKQIISFSPAALQAHYGLTPLIKQGYDGRGETIALVEAYGYDKAMDDANVAAKAFGLPALDSSNYSVIYPEGKPLHPSAADLLGWTSEIALDIQSAHAIAPGAKIVVVASSGQDNEDQIASLEYIVSHKLARTVSSSWENDNEFISGRDEENAFNTVLERGAAAGISFQFSSGDNGDNGIGPVGGVGVPSNSPYATAVGGTSVLNRPGASGSIVEGWGNNLVYLNLQGVLDPPLPIGFLGGAGGGESSFFAKPSWQKALAGTGRQVPDVSALADPYTGFAIIYTTGGVRYAQAGIGGTSLASPIFTAIWAIADQYNGKPLGFAAPTIAALMPGQIRDVVPTSTIETSNVSGTIYDASGAHFYSATDLFSGLLYSQNDFVSAIWNLDSATGVALSFGTDTSLTVTKGWDNVTGYGEPNGLPFIQGVTHKKVGAAITK